MRPLPLRLLALFLAVLPTVWGNCPCWFTEATCCGRAEERAADAPPRKPCCPRCAKHEAPAPGPAAPSPEKGPGCGGCEGCPTLAARYATSLAPAAVELPDTGGPVAVLAPDPLGLDLGADDARSARPRVPWPGPLGPPSPVETTVLRL